MAAGDEQSLAQRLGAMGYRLVNALPPQEGGTAPTATMAAPVSRKGSSLSASRRGIAQMFHQLQLSFRAGMPAYQAVTTVAAQTREGSLRRALSEIGAGIGNGRSLSELMEEYPRLFTPGDVGILRAAELGGFLPEALATLAIQHEQNDNTQRRLRIWVWFFHANVLALFLALALFAFFHPAISTMSFAVGLAAVASTFLRVTLPLTAGYLLLLAAFQKFRNSPEFARRWHAALLRLPVTGKISRLQAAATFTRVLEYLYNAGIPALEAWQTGAGAVPNVALRRDFHAAAPAVQGTGRLSEGLRQVRLFDITDAGMVATGEGAGEVGESLRYLADRYEEDTRVALGAAVVRGAITFSTWAFLIGAVMMVLLYYQFYGRMFDAVDTYFGVGQ
jgi:type II secretory pathway component PulF